MEISMTFEQLRAQPNHTLFDPPVRVKAVKDLTWSDGLTTHVAARAGDRGKITQKTNAGFIVAFDKDVDTNGTCSTIRQVFDFGEHKAEDEIALEPVVTIVTIIDNDGGMRVMLRDKLDEGQKSALAASFSGYTIHFSETTFGASPYETDSDGVIDGNN